MKTKLIAGVAIIGGLSLALTGPAAAAAGKPKHQPKPKPVVTAPQVAGSVLQTALLPPGDFGAGFTWVESGAPNSGGKLLSPGPGLNPDGMNCGLFESVIFLAAYGQTAGALESFTNPGWQIGNPDIWDGGEFVYQFATPAAAATFYHRASAEYAQCQTLTVPQPSDTSVGGGALDLSDASMTNTTVGGYRAFFLVQYAARSETSGRTFFRDTLTVVAGSDVFQIFDYSGTDDEPSPALMNELIQRVRRLG